MLSKQIVANKFQIKTLSTHAWGEEIKHILAAAIRSVEPNSAVRKHLLVQNEVLTVMGKDYALKDSVRVMVIGAGKAGFPMAKGVLDSLGTRVDGGLVIVKAGQRGKKTKLGPIKIAEGGHPIPDQRGVQATQEMVKLLDTLTARDLVVCLISGGGSALLTAPIPGVSLGMLQNITQHLLMGGATIQEINLIRKALDIVKGGGLAKIAAPAPVISLILSDVVGDRLDMIASGPTVENPDTDTEAMEIINKYQLGGMLPKENLRDLSKNPAEHTKIMNAQNVLVGNNEIAARAAMAAAEKYGIQSELITTGMQGEARQVGREMADKLRCWVEEPSQKPRMWVAGGETTVTVKGSGLGGRNLEVALAAVETLAGLENVLLVTLATDGEDGPTPAAGAVVTGETFKRGQALDLHPKDYLDNNDSFHIYNHSFRFA
ncbi:MAG: DUF4147 domain-containing protein [Chloroflexota bacterium]